jgi:uncharacterized repeat protein (TIGR04076 family)
MADKGYSEIVMADRYSVEIKVTSQQGHCAACHEVGDRWTVTRHTPAGFCVFAYSAIEPDVRTLMFGGRYPWSADKDVYVGCCPDPVNPVIFELKRIPLEDDIP